MSFTESRARDWGHNTGFTALEPWRAGDSRARLPLRGNAGPRRALGAKLSVLSVSWQPRSDSGATVKSITVLHGQLALGHM